MQLNCYCCFRQPEVKQMQRKRRQSLRAFIEHKAVAFTAVSFSAFAFFSDDCDTPAVALRLLI